MRFTRKRKTEDKIKDIHLEECQYFLYAYGKVTNKNDIEKPRYETVSKMKICLCSDNTSTPEPTPVPMPTCPLNCSISRSNCQNDIRCRGLLEAYHNTCDKVIRWNGRGEPPECSDRCKQATENLLSNGQGMMYKCCYCTDDMCKQGKKNFKDLCNPTSEESDICKMMESRCGDDGKKGTKTLCICTHHS